MCCIGHKCSLEAGLEQRCGLRRLSALLAAGLLAGCSYGLNMGKREGLFLIKKKLAAQSNGMGDQFHDTRLHLDYSTCHPGVAQPSACPAGHHDFTMQCCEWRSSSSYFTSLLGESTSYHRSLQLKILGSKTDFLTVDSPCRGQPHCTGTADKRPGSSLTAASEHKSKLQEEFSSHLSISLHIFWNAVTNSWYLLSSNE